MEVSEAKRLRELEAENAKLKREWTGDRLCRTRQEAIVDVREYVAVYYNSQRLHSTLGYRIPLDHEKDLNKVSGSG